MKRNTKKQKPINSRDKGARGERELAKWLRGWKDRNGSPVEAERGQQHSGSPESPDVKHSVVGIHIECCRSETLGVGTVALRAKAEQSQHDAAEGLIPVVVWRRNRQKWRITRPQSLQRAGNSILWTADFAECLKSRGYRRIQTDG